MKLIQKLIFILLVISISTNILNAQTLLKGSGKDMPTIDPTFVESHNDLHVSRDMFEPLMTEDKEGNLIYGQASSYTISKDQKTYTFTIRDDALWSNGEKVKASDFEFAYKRAVNPKINASYAWYFKIMVIKNAKEIIDGKKEVNTLGVKAIDDKTLEIKLEKPIPYFLIAMTYNIMVPIPKNIVEKYGENWTNAKYMVSNGPFKLKRWIKNKSLVLVKNNYYYDKDKVKLDKVIYVPMVNSMVELHKYKIGKIDITSDLPKIQYEILQKQIPNELKNTYKVGTYYYYLNMKRKPFDNVKVRKALSYSVDRKMITQTILKTGEKEAYTLVPNNVNGYTAPIPLYQTLTQKQREEKAIKLLQEVGFNKQNPLKFELLYNKSVLHKKIAQSIVHNWNKVFKGAIKVRLKSLRWSLYIKDKAAGKFHVARAGWVGDYNEASTMLDILTKGHSWNNSFYDNKKYNSLMDEARTILDDKKRNVLYQKADLILTQDMPIIPIYTYTNSRLVKPYVKGYPINHPLGSFYSRYIYIQK